MSEVFAVARREYLSRVKSKWFVLSTIGVPVLLIGAIVVNVIAASRGSQADRYVLVDESGFDVAGRALDQLETAGFRMELATGDESNRAALDQRLEDGDIGGYLVIDAETVERGLVRVKAESRPSALRRMALRSIIVGAAVEARYGDEAEALAGLLQGGELEVEVVGEGGMSQRERGQLFAVLGSTILYVALLIYGIWLLRAVLEEKTNRTVEVILSTIRPSQLMLGKVLGVGAVGLTQIGVWVALIAGAALFGLPFLIASRPELSRLADLTAVLPGLALVALFAIYFVLGFLLFASMYAAAGAMCSTEQEAQQVAQPVSMLIIVPFVIMMLQLSNGMSGAWVTPLSFVPFFAPILMFARAAAGAAPMWQIVLSWILMIAAIWAVAWVAGRIYRVGILMQGKRPTLPELMRWVREG